MVPGIEKIMAKIRSKTKAEWQDFFQEKLFEARDYVRAHGEPSALLGFASGVFVVVFFKLAIVLVCLAALAYLLILLVADTET